ncbi:MAG: hypothetical protein M1825_003572 [Sarcosagium campestre]|nr:MAG: hypothetical protein M1825_003572 [Sarcosagium campestre]
MDVLSLLQDHLSPLLGLIPPRTSLPPQLLDLINLIGTYAPRAARTGYALWASAPRDLVSLAILALAFFVSLKLLGMLVRSVIGWLLFALRAVLLATLFYAAWSVFSAGGVPVEWQRRWEGGAERAWKEWERNAFGKEGDPRDDDDDDDEEPRRWVNLKADLYDGSGSVKKSGRVSSASFTVVVHAKV